MITSLLLQVVVISHVTVVDPGEGSVRRDQTILIRGTRIERVAAASSVRAPSGARVVDGTGRFIIPGLWDMHVHTDVPGGRSLLSLYVANGVTGVRDMDGDLATLRGFQRDVASGTIAGPRMVISGPYLAGQRVPVPHLLVRTPDDAIRSVDSLQHLGVDFVKVHNGMPPAAYFAAARQARQRGIVFAGHVFPPVTPLQASDSGQRSLEHLTGFQNPCAGSDSAVIAGGMRLQLFLLGGCTAEDQSPMYRGIARNTTWVTPTLVVQTEIVRPGEAPPNDSLLHYFSDSLQALWRLMMPLPARDQVPPGAKAAGALLFEKRLALIKALHDAGVPLLAGTDAPLRPSPPGFAVHDELVYMVRAGLSPMEALRTATSEPAKYFAATDSLGTVAPGRLADLVLLAGDPTTDIHNTRKIVAVIANGRVFTDADRRQLLQGAQQAAHPPAH